MLTRADVMTFAAIAFTAFLIIGNVCWTIYIACRLWDHFFPGGLQ